MKKITVFFTASVFFLLSSCIPSLHSIVNDENRITDDRLVGNWIMNEDIFGVSNITYSVKSDDAEDQKEGAQMMQTFVDSITNLEDYSLWTFERAAKLTFKYSKLSEGTLNWTHECIGGAASTLKQLRAEYDNEDIILKEKELLPYYILTYQDADEAESELMMKVELTKIGKDLYMDIYPQNVYSEGGRFAANFIGAHTFAKLNFKGNKLLMQSFDIDHIDNLLKSKRARLKHEIIKMPSQEGNKIVYDENIVLTASTEELRAFILKYGQNEDLFDSPEELLPYNE